MSAAGPALPPHLLAKRKRQQEEEAQNKSATASGAKRSKSPEDGEKRRRVVGPAMPPAPLDERPTAPANAASDLPSDSDSDDDDGFGPALPPEDSTEPDAGEPRPAQKEATPESTKPQRDAWMTMPPQQDDLAARMDPTRQRPRTFNTGKSAKGPAVPSGADATAWHETAEQKQKRLADEMMGITSTSTSTTVSVPSKGAQGSTRAGETAQKVKQTRGPSLMEQHKTTKGKEAEDDDPSQRVFDREKDMGAGMRVGQKQREEMLKKAGGFSSKFSGGSFL